MLYALIAYLENVYSICYFCSKQQCGTVHTRRMRNPSCFSPLVVFENASCRMAINAHSWKLLSLFTQQHQQQHQRHLEMGKKLTTTGGETKNKLFSFFRLLFLGKSSACFSFFLLLPLLPVLFS